MKSWTLLCLFSLCLPLCLGTAMPRVVDNCTGCSADGSSAAQADCLNGYWIKVEVDNVSGLCKQSVESGLCVASACRSTVTRSWNLLSGVTMQFCSQAGSAPRDCRDPAPVTVAGTTSDTEGPHSLGCGDPNVAYSISVAGCGSASIEVACSACE